MPYYGYINIGNSTKYHLKFPNSRKIPVKQGAKLQQAHLIGASDDTGKRRGALAPHLIIILYYTERGYIYDERTGCK